VAVTTLFDALPRTPRNVVRAAINLVGLLFSAYMVVLGVEISRFVLRTGQVSPTLNLPMYWIYIAPTTGFALMGLRYLLELVGFQNRHWCPDAMAVCASDPESGGGGDKGGGDGDNGGGAAATATRAGAPQEG
jgi:TRAP-type C4-dicarboxylate transport system permease small subunit